MLALFSLLGPHANIFAPQVFPTSSYIPSHKVQYFVETPSSNLLTSVSPYSEAMIVILSLIRPITLVAGCVNTMHSYILGEVHLGLWRRFSEGFCGFMIQCRHINPPSSRKFTGALH